MYQCLASDFPRLKQKITAITKKLDKYGFNYSFVIGEEIGKEIPVYKLDPVTKEKYKLGTTVQTVQEYDFKMEELKLGNYEVIAVIEHNVVLDNKSDIKNIVHIINKNVTIDKHWYYVSGACDDCHDNYSRQKTIIIRDKNTNNIKQVGTGCLKKYVGIDCQDVIAAYTEITEIFINNELEFCQFNNSIPVSPYVRTKDYLAASIYYINKESFRGRKYQDNTAIKAFELAAKYPENIPNSCSEKADEIINWYKNADTTHKAWLPFDIDILTACLTEYSKISGCIAYAYIGWQNIKNTIEKLDNEEKEKKISKYVGNIGEKIETTVTCIDSFWYNSQFGTMYINIMKDEQGNKLVWYTSTICMSNNLKNKKIKIRATVKDHTSYDEEKQTVLTRVKIIEEI